ncbi:PREDICTED: uncharacterized protein LOC105145420 [Acromyrmex echinatior]|uniref:uncharacterized protein LOC105145420 n=1 Tax=Acromyrmex echinatior TaxID=103372 RepID=UPI000580E63F|nr:PREDICTED: uncharacterized protein LOC105145420 [Acromyrmex echinatior]
MNLMFRKNFGEKGLGGGGLGGGLGEVRPALSTTTYGTSGASFGQIGTRFGATRGGIGQSVVSSVRGPVRRSREFGNFPSMGDHEHQAHGYRTHLFLSPPAGGALGSPPEEPGERLGPPPRRNSGPHVIKWGGGGSVNSTQGGQTGNQARRKQNQIGQQKESSDSPSPTASRQVSFSGNRTSGTYTPLVVSGNSPPRGEPISLATLDRDCFIIPLASLERFLPAGVPHAPVADKKRPGSPLSVLEVEDPKQCVLAHFMTPLEPLDPLMESPVLMYRYLPKSVGLRRITLHKSMSQGDKMYLLICECSQLQDNLSAAAILLPALRARLCGYTGLYRPSVCF